MDPTNLKVDGTDPEADKKANPDQQNPDAAKDPEHKEDADNGQPSEVLQRYKESSKEAIRLAKEVQKQKGELEFAKKVVEVTKDAEKLKQIAIDDIDLANRISEELYGTPYSDNEDDSKTGVISTVREVLKSEKEKAEKEKIEDLEVDFFIEKGLDPSSPKYRKVFQTYAQYSPKTADQARKLLDMAYKYEFPEEKATADLSSAPTSFSGSSSSTKVDIDKELASYNQMMEAYGVSTPISKEGFLQAKKDGII